MAHILYDIVSAYWEQGLQVVMVANGPFQNPFREIVRFHDFHKRVAVCDFDEPLLQQLAVQIDTLDAQIRKLRSMRDLLLPRLLSGQLELEVA